MKDEALKQALEALSTAHLVVEDDMLADEIHQAITAIRQALAAPVQEPCGWQFYQDGKWHNGMETSNHRVNTEAAGVPVRDVYPAAPVQPGRNHYEGGDVFERIAAMNKPAAQPAPVQEPVGVFREDDDIGHVNLMPHQQIKMKDGDLVYTTPPAAQPEQKVVLVQMRAGRTWVTVDKPTVKEQKEKAQRLMRNYPGAYEMRELAIASHTRHVMYDSQAHDMKKLKEENT